MLYTVFTYVAVVAAVVSAQDPAGHEFQAPAAQDRKYSLLFLVVMNFPTTYLHCGQAHPPSHWTTHANGVAERCPCPFLNTLANHAYLPRDGVNVTRAQMNAAFDNVFNIDPAVTDPIVTKSLAGTTSALPDAINLSDLNKHNRMSLHLPSLLDILSQVN